MSFVFICIQCVLIVIGWVGLSVTLDLTGSKYEILPVAFGFDAPMTLKKLNGKNYAFWAKCVGSVFEGQETS